MTKFEMLKAAGEIVISVGVGAIVGNAVKATTPIGVGLIKKACIGISALVLANLASDSATKYTEEKIDNAVDKIKNMVKNGELE
jgi:hypothetical protein